VIEKVFEKIDSIKIVKGAPNKELKEKDRDVIDSFIKFNDTELVRSDNISNFDEIFHVLARPLHFENLYWYREVVVFLTNPLYLNTLPNIDLKTKQELQNKLRKIPKLMQEVYDARLAMKDSWWYDEAGLIRRGIQCNGLIEGMINKFVIHIPHAGVEIPDNFRGEYLLSDDELEQNINQYADCKADKLYGELTKIYDSVINPYSRLFMDPERFFDDKQETMQVKHGLGWFYENAILEKKPLRTIKNKEKIAKYYHEHHAKLQALVEEKLELFGECVIIDCHTFSNERYWFHDKSLELPDVCIGYDEFHKDEIVIEEIKRCFSHSYDTKNIGINTPYSGSLVPSKYYIKDKRVKSVMIEINKKLYLNDDNITVTNQFIPHRYRLGNMYINRDPKNEKVEFIRETIDKINNENKTLS